MRLYCKKCNSTLLINHTVNLELSSEFDYKPDMITLINHHIIKSRNVDAFVEVEKNQTFFCDSCKTDTDLKNSRFRCDDCGGLYEYKTLKEIGSSLIICKGCLNKNKSLEFFKIFGKRGPSKVRRETRAREALADAGVDIPAEMEIEEVDRFFVNAVGNIIDRNDPRNAEEQQPQQFNAPIEAPIFEQVDVPAMPDLNVRIIPEEEFELDENGDPVE